MLKIRLQKFSKKNGFPSQNSPGKHNLSKSRLQKFTCKCVELFMTPGQSNQPQIKSSGSQPIKHMTFLQVKFWLPTLKNVKKMWCCKFNVKKDLDSDGTVFLT